MATVTRKMSEHQALAAAKKRWGKYGYVRFNSKGATQAERDALPKLSREQVKALSKEDRDHRIGARFGFRCSVGVIIGAGIFPLFEVRGQADTWEEAFNVADESARKERERFAALSK